MSSFDSSFVKSQDLSDIYQAYLDNEDKIKKKWSTVPRQLYNGQVLQGNIHRHGFYFVEKEEKLFYDGLFYTNKLEGYAQVFYNDGCNFQGLFKDNIRYGPGVFTYPTGEQDVGLWRGKSINRLGSVNEKNEVPRLASTSTGQLKLLKYRYLVPVCPKKEDPAYDILKKLGATESILQLSDQLYNSEVDNKHSIFFNKKHFDKHFFTENDCSIDIVSTEVDEDSEEDSEKQEEAINEKVDINVERVRQISEELEHIERKLQAVKDKKVELEKKLEECKACCRYDRVIEEESVTAASREEVVGGVDGGVDDDDDDDDEEEVHGFMTSRIRAPIIIESETDQKGSRDEESVDTFSDLDYYDSDIFLPKPSTASSPIPEMKPYLADTCTCDEAIYSGTLNDLEKEVESITNDEVFYECISKNLKEKLQMHLEKSRQTSDVKTKKVMIKDVLAWNNEESCMRMLKQSFLHRRSEYMVNFKVSDIIAGNRHQFRDAGPHEASCVEYLNACSRGYMDTILKYIQDKHANVNVCDAKGNNAMFFAAVNREPEIVKVLVNLGVQLNKENDEGLLPLSMCLLIYLAEKNDVNNWEKCFLPDIEPTAEQEEAYKWYPNMSLLNLISWYGDGRDSILYDTSKKNDKKNYVFNTGFVNLTDEEIKHINEAKLAESKSTTFVMRHVHRRPIDESIKALLDGGANPNAGEAPLPSLFLALFTEQPNFVLWILNSNADINITLEEDLTSLHIISSLKCCQANVDICNLLIEFNCDPKLRTTTSHWQEEKPRILGNNVNPDDVEDFGKNPLHILCMRRDYHTDNCSYFQQMAEVFCHSNVDCNATYLGHTPLSLAVLVGNESLVEALMKQKVVNVHQLLNYNMGNVLTVYILKRYQDLLPPNAKEVLKCLVDQGANPLQPIGQFENAVEFMERENENESNKGKKERSPSPDKSPKKSGKAKGVLQDTLKEYIKELSRDTIIKYIQFVAVEALYNLTEEKLLEHECVPILAQFLDPEVIIRNVQNIFKYRVIKHTRYDKAICLQMIAMFGTFRKEVKPKKSAIKKKGILKKGPKKPKTVVSEPESNADKKSSTKDVDYEHMLDIMDLRVVEKSKFKLKLMPPGLDDASKYKVCFHCLKSKNKCLLACPRCQMVYFCSDTCNKANLKLKTLHSCNLQFYSESTKKLSFPADEGEHKETLRELFHRVRENCENRRLEKLKEEKELARKLLEEEMKSDTYGTKMVRRLKESKGLSRKTPTVMTLCGSVNELVKMTTDLESGKRDSLTNITTSGIVHKVTSVTKPTRKTSDEQYWSMVSKKHVSTMADLNEMLKEKKHKRNCDCEDCLIHKRGSKIKCKTNPVPTCKRIMEKIDLKEPKALINTDVTVRKLRRIPDRYKEFIKMLTQYFPEMDFTSLLLPYACYSNGHLYYKFLDNDFYTRTYSMV